MINFSLPPHRYACSRWEGLTRFLDDGRIEIDSNVVERAIRPIALNRRNALFSGSDGGGEHWVVIASLIETRKLADIEPHAYLADVITKIVNGYPNSQIDDLLPRAYPVARAPGRGLKQRLRSVACPHQIVERRVGRNSLRSPPRSCPASVRSMPRVDVGLRREGLATATRSAALTSASVAV